MKTVEVKAKKCKGIGKAKGYEGCGTMSKSRRYGLCPRCLYDWSKETKAGQEWFRSSWSKKKKQQELTQRKSRKRKRNEAKIKLLSTDGYRKKYIQPLVNQLIRLIDVNCACISSGNKGQMQAGHYYSVGSNRTLALNLHNIHIQTAQSNSWKGGDLINYRKGLATTYGEKYANFVEGLKSHPPIKLTKQDLIELKPKLHAAIKEQVKQNEYLPSYAKWSDKKRIEFRNKYNEIFGIYELGSDVFV